VSLSPSYPMQVAVVDRLKKQVSLVSGRVYDEPPSTFEFPYLTIGDDQVLADDAECVDGSEVYVTIHVWSQAVGWPEAKKVGDQVRDALHLADLTLAGHRLVEMRFRDARPLRDPDGKTRHIVITFRALTEPAD
jgi:Protein of unknown function (DUF3168)